MGTTADEQAEILVYGILHMTSYESSKIAADDRGHR
jgi:hypothetical protein